MGNARGVQKRDVFLILFSPSLSACSSPGKSRSCQLLCAPNAWQNQLLSSWKTLAKEMSYKELPWIKPDVPLGTPDPCTAPYRVRTDGQTSAMTHQWRAAEELPRLRARAAGSHGAVFPLQMAEGHPSDLRAGAAEGIW